MQIRELHIDGFGLFANHRVKGFSKGINVIYGTNEYGKTTLLEFIRRVMFGFPNKKPGVNLYPPQKGGIFGGKLVSEMANGDKIVISRTLGPYKRGDVSISTTSGQSHGQESLNAFLGNASQELYENIFAFSLVELQAAGSLQGDAIKTHIYGAGMGLGARSIIKIAENFKKGCEELFAPRGKIKKMSLLFNEMKALQREIGDIQDHLDKYGELQAKAIKLEEEKIERDHNMQHLETQRREQETKLHLFPVFVELRESEKELAELGELPEFPAHAFETFRELKSSTQSLNNRLEEENENQEKLKGERDGISVNEELLAKQEAVVSLRNMTEQIRVITIDRLSVREQKDLLEDQIQAEIKEISSDWNETTVEEFEITQAEKGYIKVFNESMVVSRQNLSRAKEKLEEYKKQKAEEMSKGLNIPEWLKVVSYSLLGLGAVGLFLGGFIISFPLLVFSIVIMVLGVVCARMIYKKKDSFLREDLFEPLLEERLARAQEEEDEQFSKWRTWLKDKKLDEFLSPTSAQEIIGVIKQAKELLHQSMDLGKRLERMHETMEKAAGLARDITNCLENLAPESDVVTAIELISRAFDDEEKIRGKRFALKTRMDELIRKTERLQEQLTDKKETLQNFILSSGVKDDKDFEAKHRQCENRNALLKTINEKRQFIQTRVGLGKAFDDFLDSIKQTCPEEIQQELDRVTSQAENLQDKKDRANQEMGETRNALNQLTSNDDLLVKQSESEIKNEQLKLCSREWVTHKIAYLMLEEAKQKYERERQPEVIRAAEHIFSRITGGKYNRIFRPLDNDEVLIDNESGDQKGVVEMSRGTREQLYLAMRLGLIEEYEKRAEPLPVIMDDVPVNFDDYRGLSVMKILKDFAKTRQVIVLSCHNQSLENYKRLGASQVAV
ncbi:MAG: AAA family ATPase [Nitrospinota bacterium]|nr:AAA family ATPase [Nitrospinota bacterium]